MTSYFLVLMCALVCSLILCASSQDIKTNKVVHSEKVTTKKPKSSTTKKLKTTKHSEIKNLVCPKKGTRVPFFSLPCATTKDCAFLGSQMMCCNLICQQGVPPPTPEPTHAPFFGVIDRVCPLNPIAELFDVKECTRDEDCIPRICCSERHVQSSKKYCRTAAPRFDRMPAAERFFEPFKGAIGYMQCTPPPPPFLDLFPKPCNNGWDCFPNLCCQEKGKKYCRPPKRSLLTLLTTMIQRISASEISKQFIQRVTQ